VIYDAGTKTVKFVNSGPMVENRRYYISFDVTYASGAPAGTIFQNVLGETVNSYLPVSVMVVKEDGTDNSKKLGGAEFVAYHATADGTGPDTTKLTITGENGALITGSKVTTAAATGEANFFFSPSAEEFRKISTTTPFVFFLVETKAPEGYVLDPTPIKYTITKNAEGNLLMIADRQTVSNALGSIETSVKNDVDGTPRITIGTKAREKDTDLQLVNPDGTVTIVDTVSYTGLTPGVAYTLSGTLHDKSTGDVFKDNNGADVTATETFTPTSADGTTKVEFTFSASALKGKTLVVFERLYVAAEYDEDKPDENVIAKHEEIGDVEQTIYFPKVRTSAVNKSTGDRTPTVAADTEITIVDTVSYENLIPGKEYTLKGILMNGTTGQELKIGGQTVEKTGTFIPLTSNGSTTLEFKLTIPKALFPLKTVVFEELYLEGHLIGAHRDIEDENQTVTFDEEEEEPEIKIGTSARDKATGTQQVKPEENVTIIDTVSYEGLTVGKTYTVKGTLRDKATGAVLKVNDVDVTAEKEFTPTTANGTVELEFTFNASALAGKTLVVFEKLFLDGKEVAAHEDINDAAQTVTVEEPSFFISKREIAKDNELPGATLAVYETDAEGKRTDVIATTISGEKLTWVSGTVSKKIEGLSAGTYILRETIAPNGYALATDIKFSIDENGKLTSTGEVTSDGKTLIMRDALKSVSSQESSSDGPDNTSSNTISNNNSSSGSTYGGGNDNLDIPVTGSFVPFIGFLLAVAFLAVATVMTTKRRRRTNR